MGNFDRGNRSGGRGSYGGGNRYGGGGRSYGGGRDFSQGGGDRPMFQAVCAKCGKNCEVPFKPTGDRPVYCKDCFRESGEGEGRRPERREERSYSRPSNNEAPSYKEEFQALSNKLDRIIDLLTPQAAPEVSDEQEVPDMIVPEKKKRTPKKTSDIQE